MRKKKMTKIAVFPFLAKLDVTCLWPPILVLTVTLVLAWFVIVLLKYLTCFSVTNTWNFSPPYSFFLLSSRSQNPWNQPTSQWCSCPCPFHVEPTPPLSDGPAVVRVNVYVRSISRIDDVTMVSVSRRWGYNICSFSFIHSFIWFGFIILPVASRSHHTFHSFTHSVPSHPFTPMPYFPWCSIPALEYDHFLVLKCFSFCVCSIPC